MALEVGTTVEFTIEPPDKEYNIKKGDIGVITYVGREKYSIHIDGKINQHDSPARIYGNKGDFWISLSYVKQYIFKKGDRVQIVSKSSKYKGSYGTVKYDSGIVYKKVRIDGTLCEPEYSHLSLRLVNNEREVYNMKLTGFTKVAVINICNKDYYYALYDNDIKADDNVLVTGRQANQILTVKDVVTLEECANKFDVNKICAEVICKVDLSAYNTRLDNRKKAVELRKKMDAQIAAMDEMNKYVLYAERNPELAKMLEEYRELV